MFGDALLRCLSADLSMKATRTPPTYTHTHTMYNIIADILQRMSARKFLHDVYQRYLRCHPNRPECENTARHRVLFYRSKPSGTAVSGAAAAASPSNALVD